MVSRLACLLISSSFCFFAQNVVAKPYTPASDEQILEYLPFKANDPLARELAQLRANLKQNPENLEIALKLARRYYGLIGGEGDPRYLGYAQAALAPWWHMRTPPVGVQIIRASIRQFRHDFAGAVEDLTAVIAQEPYHAEARLLRAIIHIVQARYADARTDCLAMRQQNVLIAVGCEAIIDGTTGNAKRGYEQLLKAMSIYHKAMPGDKLWVQVRLAELAQRLNMPELAVHHYKQALALNIDDGFLLASYADLLLDQNQPAAVVKLLKEKNRSDVLLLRLAFAERTLNLPEAAEHEAALSARFKAARMRGESIHEQEEARFALRVEKNPEKALRLAQENWKVQREPRDARIYLEAAIALKDAAAARPVLQWLEESGIEDPYLVSLGRQLREIKK